MSYAYGEATPPPSSDSAPGWPQLAPEPLIQFDRRTAAFFAVLFGLLAVGTALKVHGSSIGMWHVLLGPEYRSPDSGVLFGTPKGIRIDEWNIFTPAILSQATVHPSFPIVNPRWGQGEVPLVFKFPARHWSMLFRPQFWGFFVLDLERAFAFYWDIRAVLLLGGTFLLLMVLTENDFWISVFGGVWLFFSGFIQWWYSNQLLPEIIGITGLLVVAAHYVALSPRRWVIVFSGLVFLLCAFNFALALYPPYQVPLFYIGVVLLVASLTPRVRRVEIRNNFALRIASSVFVLIVLALLLAQFYRDAKEGVNLMRATVYPGSRLVSGGDLTLAQTFGGFFGFFMTEQRFPEAFGGNVCESSNFVLLFPIPMLVLIWRWWRKEPVTPLEWALVAYIAVFLTWIVVGWPHWLAAASGFGLTQPVRSQLALGLGSILLCCIFLSKSRIDLPRGFAGKLAIGCSIVAILVAFALYFNRATSSFAMAREIALVVLIGGATCYLLLARQRLAFAICLLAPHVWSYGLVNPVAVGLGPILNAKLLRQVTQVVDRDPEARWASYLDSSSTTFLKVAGAKVFNGINITPPMNDFRTIDPAGLAKSIYNRYGYIGLVPGQGPNVTFSNAVNDVYMMAIDPKNDLWRKLGIRYIVLPSASTDPEFLAKTEPIQTIPGLWIYKYRSDRQ